MADAAKGLWDGFFGGGLGSAFLVFLILILLVIGFGCGGWCI